MHVCSVCGTLINFSADASVKGELVSLGAPARLVDVLERCLAAEEPGDMEVRDCRVFWMQ